MNSSTSSVSSSELSETLTPHIAASKSSLRPLAKVQIVSSELLRQSVGFLFVLGLLLSGTPLGYMVSLVPAAYAAPAAAPDLSATKTASFDDNDGDGKANPGQTVTYSVTVKNNGTSNADNVTFSDTLDSNTTLVPDSVKSTPLAVDDNFSTLRNDELVVGALSGLLANDRDPDTGNNTGLSVTAPSATDQGGTVSVGVNGSFTYNPPSDFEGTDTFTYTVTDATSLSSTAIASITVAIGAPSHLAIITQPASTATSGATFSQQPVLEVRDSVGNLVPTSGIDVTVQVASGGGALGGTTTVSTSSSGRASFTNLSLTGTVGDRTLSFTSIGLTNATSNTITLTAGTAAQLSLTTQPSSIAKAGEAFIRQPILQLQDASGNSVSQAGVTVTAAIASGGGVLGGTTTSSSDTSGILRFTDLSITGLVGEHTLSFSAAGLTAATSDTILLTAGVAAQIALTTQPSTTAQAGVNFARQPVLQVQDASGNAVAQSGVSVTATIASGGGVLGGTTPVSSNAQGVITFTDLSLSGIIGDRTLSFSTTGLTGTTSGTITLTAGSASQLVLTTQPAATAKSGVSFSQQPVLQVQDASGNAVSQAGISVTAARASGTAVLGGTVSLNTDAAGAATFTDLSLTGAIGDHTLSFSVAGLTGATSHTIVLTAGAAAQLSVSTQPSATAQAGVAFVQQPVIQLQDASGNVVAQAGVAVTAAIASGGGTLGGTSTVNTDDNGSVSFTDLSIGGTVGNRTLSFSATGLTGATSNSITLTAGPASAIAFGVQPSNVVASAPITPAVQAKIVDAFGNTTSSTQNVTLSIGNNPSGGTLSGTTTQAAVNGVATFSNLSINLVGTGYTMTAIAASLTSATSNGFNVTHGPLDHFLVEDAGGGTISDKLAGTPFNVRVTAQDAYNNTVTSFTGTVSFSSTPSGGISAGSTSVAFTAGLLASHSITFNVAGEFTLTATGGGKSGTSNSFGVQAPPVAVDNGPAANSAPGQAYHTFYSTSGTPQTFTLPAPGVLSNDNLGYPTATITSFSIDSGGGSFITRTAGDTLSPLPGTGVTTGSIRVDSNGAINFTPSNNFTGLFKFQYRLTNAGGYSDAEVTIAVGQRPSAASDSYSPVLVGNVPINTASSTQFKVSANDTGDGITRAVTGQTNGTASFNSDGTFNFRPNPGYEGPASFTYTVTNGFGTTPAATVSLTVGTPIWFINAAASAGGDGRYDAPFNSLSSFANINNGTGSNPAANDRVFFYTGTYNGPVTLLSGQRLIGQGATASLSSIANVTWPADSSTEPAMNGTAPLLTASNGTSVTLANIGSGNLSNNTLWGLNFGDVGSTGTALSGTNFGALFLREVGINTDGRALNMSTGMLNGGLTMLRSSGGPNNLVLTNVATISTSVLGTSSDTLSGATSDAFKVDGGNGSFIFNGNISNSAAKSVNILNKNGGTVDFGGTISSSTNGTGVTLSSNSGTTFNFTGVLTLNGASTTFTATTGGTVNVSGDNNTIGSSVPPSLAIALNVANTTIGGTGIKFKSISSNGGQNGIVLNNTGSGGLLITGDGSTFASGGTIKNAAGGDGATAGNGIYLKDANNIDFRYMDLSNHQNNGLYGEAITGLQMNRLRFTGNNGTSNSGEFNESAIHLLDTGGTVKLLNSTANGGAMNAVRIRNTSSVSPNLNLEIANVTVSHIQGSTSDVRGSAILAVVGNVPAFAGAPIPSGGGTITANIHDNNLSYWWGNAIHVMVQGNASGSATIANNQATQTSGALAGAGGIWVAGGNLTYNITGNNVQNTNGTAISADRGQFGTTMSGVIDGNTIGTSGVANSGTTTGIGIFASHHGTGVTNVKISNNTLRQINGSASGAITTQTGDAAGFGGSGTVNVTIVGNDIRESGTTFNSAQHGILITHDTSSTPPPGSTTGDATIGCYTIGGPGALANTIANLNTGDANTANDNRIRVNYRFFGKAMFPGYTGGNTDSAALTSYLLARNVASNISIANTSTAGFTNTPGGASCTQPLLLGADTSSTNSSACGVGSTTVPTLQAVASPNGKAKAELSQTELNALVKSATSHWKATDLSAEQEKALGQMTWSVAELTGPYLGETTAHHITLDSDAGGRGWYLGQIPTSTGRVHALTAVLHEMGHVLGLPDTYLAQDKAHIMYGYLSSGEHRLPKLGDASGALPMASPHQQFLQLNEVTIDIGTLPPGKSVTITFQATINNPLPAGVTQISNQGTINNPLPAGVTQISNQGTVSGDNFTTIQTDAIAGGTADATITQVTSPPSDITLTPSSIAENKTAGAVVGTLSTTDADGAQTHTYTLVTGTGDTNNSSFTIDGASLKTVDTFDYETKASYTIRVKSTDTVGASFEKVITVTITDANDAPTDIALSGTSVEENEPTGTTVGTLSTTDADAGDSSTYQFVTGSGSADNDAFILDGATLKTAAVFRYLNQKRYSIRVQATDRAGATFKKTFNINIIPETVAPALTIAAPSSQQRVIQSAFTPGNIHGNATDNKGVAKVQVQLFRVRQGEYEYWNGTKFTLSKAYVSATLGTPGGTSTTWSLQKHPAKSELDFGSYGFYVYAVDTAGNESAGLRRDFWVIDADITAPDIVLAAPTSSQHVPRGLFNPGSITGSATDNKGVSGVMVHLFRFRDGAYEYWNGTTFTASRVAVSANLSSVGATSTTWSLQNHPPQQELDFGGYGFYAYAVDAAGNKSANLRRDFSVFDLDASAPEITLIAPSKSQHIRKNEFLAGSIHGSASDDKGIARVRVQLFRFRDGAYEYWNGTTFTRTKVSVMAKLDNSGAASTTWSLENHPPQQELDLGGYGFYAEAFDTSGKKSANVRRDFSVVASSTSGASNSTVQKSISPSAASF